MDIASHLNRKSILYYRPTRTSDGSGSFGFGYPEVGSPTGTVNCRKRPIGSRELETASQEKVKVTHVIYFDMTATMVRDDKLVIGGIDYILRVNLSPSEDVFQKWAAEEIQKGK